MTFSKENIRHIFWDWNGTLMDDAWLCVATLNTLLRNRGMAETNVATYRQVFSFPVRAYYERLGFDFTKEDMQLLSIEYIDGYNARRYECALHSGTRELLAELQQLGKGQSILSAYRQDMLEDTIKGYSLSSFFTHLAGTDNLQAQGKRDQGKRLLEKLHLPPTAVIMIGDTLHDLEVAEAIGCPCILVGHGHCDANRLRGHGVPVAESIADLRLMLCD